MPIHISPRVVLLIDADNVPPNYFSQTLNLSSPYGSLTICRAYSDWKKPPLFASTARPCIPNIEVVQVDRVSRNATDRKLKQDMAEILHLGNTDIFIIASGDGDFAACCKQVKQQHLKVIGIGLEGQTSKRLVQVCNEFHYLKCARLQKT